MENDWEIMEFENVFGNFIFWGGFQAEVRWK